MPNAYSNLILRYGDKFITVDVPAQSGNQGQCIFPGGTVDQSGQCKPPATPDPSMRYAALREFDEETRPNNPNDKSFKALLADKGLSFEAIESHMKLVGAMDNEHEQGVPNAGHHAYYELDLSRVPAFSPPTFTQADFESFGNKLSPQDDLKNRNGAIKVRDLSELKTTLLPNDQFKGGLRATAENICNSGGMDPQITTYDSRSGQKKTDIQKMHTQWEQDLEKKLSLASKLQNTNQQDKGKTESLEDKKDSSEDKKESQREQVSEPAKNKDKDKDKAPEEKDPMMEFCQSVIRMSQDIQSIMGTLLDLAVKSYKEAKENAQEQKSQQTSPVNLSPSNDTKTGAINANTVPNPNPTPKMTDTTAPEKELEQAKTNSEEQKQTLKK